MSHTTYIGPHPEDKDRPEGERLGDGIIHGDPAGFPLLWHPLDSNWVWCKSCGFVAKDGEILEAPIAASQPLVNPDELEKLNGA